MYKADKAMSNTLYGGDRAGSRYYWVMENTTATESANYTSGLINPGFKNKVTAFQMNPFVKYRGLEVFGVLERAEGKASAEPPSESGSSTRWIRCTASCRTRRCSWASATTRPRASSPASPVTSARIAGRSAAAGSSRRNVLAKVEYVNQKYFGYPATNIRNGGKFNGMMLEGVIAF